MADNLRFIKVKPWWLILLVTFVASIPYFANYVPFFEGQDLQFHLCRIAGIADALAQGEIPVRMQWTQINGYGYPVSILYGDLFLYIPACLHLMGCPVLLSYNIFVILVNGATAWIAYLSLEKIIGNKWVSLLGATLWTLAPYRLLDIYVRAAVGEFLAITFIPLCALGVWMIFFSKERNSFSSCFIFALGFSSIIYSHVISAFIVAIFIFPAIVLGLIFRHDRATVILLLASIGLTLLLSAAFLIPFFDFYGSESLKVNSASSEKALSVFNANLLQPSQLFMLFPTFTGSYSAPAAGDIYGTSPSIGWPIAFLLLLYCFGLPHRKIFRMGGGLSKSIIEPLLVLIALFTYISTTTLFPWEKLEAVPFLSRAIALFAQIQMPMRILSMANFATILVGCLALSRLRKDRWKAGNTVIVALLIFCFVQAGANATSFMEEAQPLNNYSSIENAANIGAGEYLPEGASRDFGDYSSFESEDVVAHVSGERGDFVVDYRAGNHGAMIALPRLYYGNYEIVDNAGIQGLFLQKSPDGKLQLEVPPNSSGSIEIMFAVPPIWNYAFLLSVLSFLIGLAMAIRASCAKGQKSC